MRSFIACCLTIATLFCFLSRLSTASDLGEGKPLQIELTDISVPQALRHEFHADKTPNHIKKLDGKKVVIRGYMRPGIEETNIRDFVLNPETKGKAFHWAACADQVPLEFNIIVTMKPGHSLTFDWKPLEISGTLEIAPLVIDGVLYQLFKITNASAKTILPRKGYSRSIGWGC